MGYAVQMKGITKSFPGVLANDGIDFAVEENEIHCLLGENGCGKSTLMNVLFGIHKQEAGEILIKDKKSTITNTKEAHDAGIGMVHQHFMLVNPMTALDNIMLGKEPIGLFLDRQVARREISAMIEKYGFQIDLDASVSELAVGIKQRMEIVKILYRGADIIIMDEPTAVLTPQEVQELFKILTGLKADGKTIIFITHKLEETMAISDRVTVLRGGKKVKTVVTAQSSEKELARYMVGYDVNFDLERPPVECGDILLEVRNVQLLPNARHSVSFEIRKGEILGIAGVDGNGQQELEEMIMGVRKAPKGGSIIVNGSDITGTTTKFRKAYGMGHIPSDRYKSAMVKDFSVRENYMLGFQDHADLNTYGFIKHKVLAAFSQAQIKKYNVVVSSDESSIGTLSGGNQQKVIISRELGHDPDVVIVAQPTRGLDIGAIEFVHSTLIDLRRQGKAVLLISVELTEIMTLSDRIAVLCGGEIMDSFENSRDVTREQLGLLMAGKAVGGSYGEE
ncbi:MAG: ABC transporter ATP-binding protein [Oscillospiraceae bacterium]|nr:ABC transporter ATP-binding protein [Oscillospiraceae bacterium]